MAATAAPLAAMTSANSATPIAGVGLGILPNTPSIVRILAATPSRAFARTSIRAFDYDRKQRVWQ